MQQEEFWLYALLFFLVLMVLLIWAVIVILNDKIEKLKQKMESGTRKIELASITLTCLAL